MPAKHGSWADAPFGQKFPAAQAVHAVAPAGTRDLNEAPDFVRDFGGAADAADAYEEAMLTWADSKAMPLGTLRCS